MYYINCYTFLEDYAQPCHQLYSILKEEVKQLLRNIAFVSEQLAVQSFSKNLELIRVLVADICTSKYKRYYLASVIARKVEFKAMAPTHCSFSVSGNSLEYLIGISPEIMAYRYQWNQRMLCQYIFRMLPD